MIFEFGNKSNVAMTTNCMLYVNNKHAIDKFEILQYFCNFFANQLSILKKRIDNLKINWPKILIT